MRITVGQLRRIIRETIEEETRRRHVQEGLLDSVKGMFGKGKPKGKPEEKAPPTYAEKRKAEQDFWDSPEYKAQQAKFAAEKKAEEKRRGAMSPEEREAEDRRRGEWDMRHFH